MLHAPNISVYRRKFLHCVHCLLETKDDSPEGDVFTFIVSTENKCPVVCHDFKFVVLGCSGHLDSTKRNHTFWVCVL